jgi:hypothetical protein
LLFGFVLLFCLEEQWSRKLLESAVSGHSYGVLDALFFAVIVDGGDLKPRVRPDRYLNLWPSRPQTSHNAL